MKTPIVPTSTQRRNAQRLVYNHGIEVARLEIEAALSVAKRPADVDYWKGVLAALDTFTEA